MSKENAELRKRVAELESDTVRLNEEVDQLQTQLKQYRAVNESQKAALADKDSLLEQLTQVNESLKNDITLLKEIKPKIVSASALSLASNPWMDSSLKIGIEPEQFRKLFVGGLNHDTTEVSLKEYFEKFGEVEKATVIYDAKKQSRGFGFIIYKTSAMIDAAQAGRPHVVDDRTVDTKRVLPKEETDKPENNIRVNKVFVGGFNRETEEHHLKEYFSHYGNVECVEMLVNRSTGKKRGFAFVLFDDYDAVDKAVLIKHHVVNGSRCEVKKAVFQDKFSNKGARPSAPNGGSWDKPRNFDPPQPQDTRSYGNYGSGSGNSGRNQGNFGGNNDGNIGNNQANYGNYGRNSGDFNAGSNQYGGGNPGNYDNFGGNANNLPSNFQKSAMNFGTSSQPPDCSTQPPPMFRSVVLNTPEMAAMWAAFSNQYGGSMSQPANNSGGGPMRGNTHTQRAPGPYNSSGYGTGSGQDGQSTSQTN